ncbi:rRNA maturation RNase YbeY [Stakelama sp. CBK3Z-3]|uniref:Endoribonuclease YbeY n=1 Tax=Stakelama flava TaxID=2860338 RepID=A0ABS6XNV0_9SPHN|nr:rRNA maturation RNase YbeY [Stakelama flava]MBW4331897.1 rRNA maturation RNase YbeY [Stakelama flava]
MLEVAVQREGEWSADIDWEKLAGEAARAAISRTPQAAWVDDPAMIEIAVRLTSNDEVHQLNHQFRHKDKPTNVLSFPMIQPDLLDTVTLNSDDGEVLLGDIVLAHGVCASEAETREISVADHASHLIVHGCLHLLGFDHQGDAEAEAMEDIERAALSMLGLHDPYPVRED